MCRNPRRLRAENVYMHQRARRETHKLIIMRCAAIAPAYVSEKLSIAISMMCVCVFVLPSYQTLSCSRMYNGKRLNHNSAADWRNTHTQTHNHETPISANIPPAHHHASD